MLDLLPSARVGHIGLYRDPDTLVAVEYYFKVPEGLPERPVIMLDPMLATANSAIAAVERIKEVGARNVKMVCLLAAPEGIRAFNAAHPDVPIFTASIDERLDHHGVHRPRARRRRRPTLRHALRAGTGNEHERGTPPAASHRRGGWRRGRDSNPRKACAFN